MSKGLAKILSFCACIILIPLVILGIAMGVNNNKIYTLSVYEHGDEIAEGMSSEVVIYVNSKPQKETEISAKNGTKVTVTWKGTGFSFVGWYEGGAGETETVASTNTSYTFKLNSNRALTAKRVKAEYILNVKLNGVSEQVDQVTYSEETGFSAYSVERDYYTFDGFLYNSNLYEYSKNGVDVDYIYNGAKLSNVIKSDLDHYIDVTASWTAEYPDANFTLYTKVDGIEGAAPVHAVNGTTDVILGVGEAWRKGFAFIDKDEDACKDLTDNVIDSILDYQSYYINAEGGTKKSVVVNRRSCSIEIQGETFIHTFGEDYSFGFLLSYAEFVVGVGTFDLEDLEFKITFSFDIVEQA